MSPAPKTSTFADLRNPVGTHVRVGRRLVTGAIPTADRIGCETIQVFVGNPGGWAQSAGEPYLAALDGHPQAGICLDTCHVFACGASLDEPGGPTATVDRIAELGGSGRLRLVHANDSKDVRGAYADRHEKIGEGHIGVPAFEELLAHPALSGVPVIETPGSRDEDDHQIELLEKLRPA